MTITKLIILGYLLIFCESVQAQVHVQELRVELLKTPLGIEVTAPRLSWQLNSKMRNVSQVAYEIRISKEVPALLQNRQLVWHTGKVVSNESLHVAYAGEQLQSGQKYYWQVRVWDNKGNVSAWSDVVFWQMGLLAPEDWKGKWIGLDVDYTEPGDDHRKLPARMARREFKVTKPIAEATLFLSGLGFSECYLNGSKLDNRIMDPTHSNYKNRVMYVVFDVKKFLKPGQNAVGVILGNGRFFAPRSRIPVATPNFGFPKMLMQIQVQYADGTSTLITSDDKWKITDQGPIRANNEFDGEEYDANMEQEGWSQAGFNDIKWQYAQMVQAPDGKLIAQIQEPMRVIEKLPPVSIQHSNSGGYLVDFGQKFLRDVPDKSQRAQRNKGRSSLHLRHRLCGQY